MPPVKITMAMTKVFRVSILMLVRNIKASRTPIIPPKTRPAKPVQLTLSALMNWVLEAVIIMAASSIMTGMAMVGLSPIREKKINSGA